MSQVKMSNQEGTREEKIYLIKLVLLKKKRKQEKELEKLKKEFRMLIQTTTDEPLPNDSLQVNRQRRETLEKCLSKCGKVLKMLKIDNLRCESCGKEILIERFHTVPADLCTPCKKRKNASFNDRAYAVL